MRRECEQAAAPTAFSRLSTLKQCSATHFIGRVRPGYRRVVEGEEGNGEAACRRTLGLTRRCSGARYAKLKWIVEVEVVCGNAPADHYVRPPLPKSCRGL